MNKIVDALNPNDEPRTFYVKMTRMSVNQLENEAKRFNRYAELSHIINCYLMVRRQPPEIKVEMIFDESGWHLKFSDRLDLVEHKESTVEELINIE